MSAQEFDAIVVGSGFGGSVMAYRLAEAGLRVCLLERGKAYPPNSFPRAPYEMSRNFWDPSEGLYGVFNVWSFKGSGAVVSSGLGGGSLIYANVLLRKDEAWFKEDRPDGSYEPWPVQYAELEPHYADVERMMNAQTYPLRHAPYADTPKTLALQAAAAKWSGSDGDPPRWMPLNLAVSFRQQPVASPGDDDPRNPPRVGEPLLEEAPNLHGSTRSTCRLCGECDIGCNFGSKNTLDYTYLSAAKRLGADVRPLAEVKTIDARGDGRPGYAVEYVEHQPERFADRKRDTSDPSVCPPLRLHCKRLILSAGTFGTPFLLFKNAARLPGLSSRLGTRFSVNGDLLSFFANARESRDGRPVPRRIDPSFGPVITGAVRFGDALDGASAQGRGFYVEDGGYPYLLGWASELSGLTGALRRALHFVALNLKYRLGLAGDTDLGAEIAGLLGDCATSRSSMPVLTMGRDRASGRMSFDGRYLDCDWSERDSREYYGRVERALKRMAEAIGAEYVDNPAWRWNFHQVLTAHPLGGCPMGRSAGEGVVSPYGEVFGHPGLYVADGSVMPGPVGANPSLTIAALADRFAARIAEEKG